MNSFKIKSLLLILSSLLFINSVHAEFQPDEKLALQILGGSVVFWVALAIYNKIKVAAKKTKIIDSFKQKYTKALEVINKAKMNGDSDYPNKTEVTWIVNNHKDIYDYADQQYSMKFHMAGTLCLVGACMSYSALGFYYLILLIKDAYEKGELSKVINVRIDTF